MGSFFVKKLHTLDTFSFSFHELNKEWGCDKRYGMDTLQRFLYINRPALKYLDIQAEIEVIGNDPYLKLTTSNFAGCVSIMSPKDGKPCGDLCVGGRFGEDLSELLSVINDTFLVEYNDILPPLSTSTLEPPIYFECCNFIDILIEVERSRWHKFDVIECTEGTPSNGTQWRKYALQSYNPASLLSFPNRSNRLKPYHKEFCQLLSVLNICIKEINRPQTPIRSRIAYASKIDRLQSKYDESLAKPLPVEFIPHASDPIAVKKAKFIANVIIKNKRTEMRSWRIDYSVFFERFIQYIFGEVAISSAAKTYCNPHYSVTGNRPVWALNYLEPDMIIQKGDHQIVLDAKYKSHIFNWNNASDNLKDTFRHDLHQILAYCSFNPMKSKKAFLVYPYHEFTYHRMHLNSPLTTSSADVYMIGIPLIKNKLEEVKIGLSKIVGRESEE